MHNSPLVYRLVLFSIRKPRNNLAVRSRLYIHAKPDRNATLRHEDYKFVPPEPSQCIFCGALREAKESKVRVNRDCVADEDGELINDVGD
jgi:hypothetical protein